jgi:F420-non-reducing hydrogenase small subunit
MDKPKLSMYWAASCGGCEIALVNLHEKILEVDRVFDFFFCPCLLDTKKADVEALPDGALTITFFNGAIRTAENREMARLMRAKSQLLIAFGACACSGSIPALSNLHSREAQLRTNYLDSPSLDNPAGTLPQLSTAMPEGELELPEFFETVESLAQVVPVDYFIPGCPPEPHQIWNVVEAVIQGAPLPPKGSVLGAGVSSVCDECKREKNSKRIARFHRTYEIVTDPRVCLLEQGLVCMGIATRDGCGALCPQVNMPCMGCYGPPEGVADQGAKMISALGSVLDLGDYKGVTEEQVAEKTDAAIAGLPDQAGVFYKFSLSGAIWGSKPL